MASPDKQNPRKAFERARDVHPVGITGREAPADIISKMFPAYVGRQERTAFELMRRSSQDDTCTFMTMSGAMTPAGLHQSCVIPLIERGLVDCLTTTGANLYHDAHRIIGHRIRGGVPKNYTLQGEPLLDQILGVPTHGFDFDVQFCVDPVDNGALSSCPAGEGHTWGKVSAESVQYGSMYVHCDVTAVFPWLTYALLSDPRVHRKPRRLYDARAKALTSLQREIDKRRKKLEATVKFDMPKPKPKKKSAKK